MSDGWAEPWIFPLPWPPLADPATQIGLRPWGAGEEDPVVLAAAWADPEVIRFTAVPDDASVEAARTWIRGEEVRRSKGLAMDLVISKLEEPARVLGEVGLAMVEPDKGWAELGFWLVPEARGGGRASAAATLFADWVLRELPVQRLFARTQPENPKAGRVADAAGLTRAGELESGTEVWIRDRG